jgi:hypothetical protein
MISCVGAVVVVVFVAVAVVVFVGVAFVGIVVVVSACVVAFGVGCWTGGNRRGKRDMTS